MVVGTDGGPPCVCGKSGCLETWLSIPHLTAALADAAADVDRARLAILTVAGERLGIALSPVVGALDVHEIVLNGPPEILDGPLSAPALATIRARAMSEFHSQVTLRMSTLDPTRHSAGPRLSSWKPSSESPGRMAEGRCPAAGDRFVPVSFSPRGDTCAELGITPKRTRPCRPQTNGKLERFHRTLADGWAYARFYESERTRRDALPDWLHFYNHHRHHSAIGAPPTRRLNNLPGHHS